METRHFFSWPYWFQRYLTETESRQFIDKKVHQHWFWNSSLTKLTTFHWHFWRQFIHADERITVFEYEYEVICFHCQLPANPPDNWSILWWIRGRKENHCGGRMSGRQRGIAGGGRGVGAGSKNNYQPGVRLLVKKLLYFTIRVLFLWSWLWYTAWDVN